MLNTLLANPTVQQLIANPDVMKRLIVENPLCKEMLEVSTLYLVCLTFITFSK